MSQLREQPAQLLERTSLPDAHLEVDGEVDAGCGFGRIDDSIGDRGLNRNVLKVAGACVEEEGLLTVVDRDLADR